MATNWVDVQDPPIEVSCVLNQRLQFEIDRNILGTGTNSNFNGFKILVDTTATSTNNHRYPNI